MRKKILNIEGESFEYYTAGNGKIPLICVHGWGASFFDFIPNLSYLEKFCTIYLFNFPGNYNSKIWNRDYYMDDYVYFLESFIQELDLNNFILMGQSFGSLIILKYIMNTHKQIKGLILISPVINIPNNITKVIAKFIRRNSKNSFLKTIAFTIKNSRIYYRIWMPLISNAKLKSYRKISAVAINGLKKVNEVAYIQGFAALLEYDSIEALKYLFENVNIKKILVYGQMDRLSGINKIPNFVKSFGNLYFLENSGHCPNREKKALFHELLESFFKEL